jgi:alpha-amylase
MNTDSDIYKMTAAINKARHSTSSYDHQVDEKYVEDNFYAFARGDMFVALTNSYDQVQYTVPNLPWSDGTTVCNIYNGDDCQQIQGGSMQVTLVNGENKIYVPKTNSFFDSAEELFVQS